MYASIAQAIVHLPLFSLDNETNEFISHTVSVSLLLILQQYLLLRGYEVGSHVPTQQYRRENFLILNRKTYLILEEE